MNGNTCVILTACPAYTYGNTSTFVCTNCHSSCTTCSGSLDSECDTCGPINGIDLFKIVTGYCVAVCPEGAYGFVHAPYACMTCNGKCSACSGNADNCSACKNDGADNFLTGNTCVVAASCPTKTYA